ncbi:MAG TPA: esterase, partial [Isosphaeraceae bacterium]|nr:esterase [Isosphaeraceae bacterium]
MTNDRLNAPASSSSSMLSPLVEARFIPRQYEPNYAYPLLVLFHARGGDEDQLVRAMPALSWRNYVGLGLRGPEPVIRRDRLGGFSWGRDFELHDRASSHKTPRWSEAEIVRRAFFEP